MAAVPFNLGGPELIFLLVVFLMLGGIPGLIAWRRGGSVGRIAATVLVAVVPYVGWIVSWGLALTTRRVKKCPQCAEDVRPEALVCPHCQFRFDMASGSASTA